MLVSNLESGPCSLGVEPHILMTSTHMSSNVLGSDFFDSAVVVRKIEDLWAKVFLNSNKVLSQHFKFGYDGVMTATDPTIHERMVNLQVFSAIIDVLINSATSANIVLDYEQTRQLLNAKAQITTMEQVATAILAKNKEDYEFAVEALDRQAVI